MKIFKNKIKENWIIDRLIKEWDNVYPEYYTNLPKKADIIWIIAPWLWKSVSKSDLKSKKVICSIYHIDKKTYDYRDFYELDNYVDEYHVISNKTKKDLELLTDKKITSIPFWVNQKNFYYIDEKIKLRERYGFESKDFIVGSFQRDTEGVDLISPKMIKGPDILIESLLKLRNDNQNLRVLIAGNRRQYVLQKLNEYQFEFKYFEMVDINTLNNLYNILDLYLVTSRLEGGPQAILECSQTKTKIMSTDVGVAPEILSRSALFNLNNFDYDPNKLDVEHNFISSSKYTLPNGAKLFNNMFLEIYES